MAEWCAPPSMALFLPQPSPSALDHTETGLQVTGKPFSKIEKARYWLQSEVRKVHEVTGSVEDREVRLGHKVAASHLPNKFLLVLEVLDSKGVFVGYQCPCGTHLTKTQE